MPIQCTYASGLRCYLRTWGPSGCEDHLQSHRRGCTVLRVCSSVIDQQCDAPLCYWCVIRSGNSNHLSQSSSFQVDAHTGACLLAYAPLKCLRAHATLLPTLSIEAAHPNDYLTHNPAQSQYEAACSPFDETVFILSDGSVHLCLGPAPCPEDERCFSLLHPVPFTLGSPIHAQVPLRSVTRQRASGCTTSMRAISFTASTA